MNYYLVDYENTGPTMLNEVPMKKNDKMIVFYTDACLNAPERVMKIIGDPSRCYFEKVNNGMKNALDMQLSSYLGGLIREHRILKKKYCIVSNDKGYDCICKYWSDKKEKVARISLTHPDKSAQIMNTEASSVQNLKLDDIKRLFSLSYDPDSEKIFKIYQKSHNRPELVVSLQKYYRDTKKATAVFNRLKPYIKEKEKMLMGKDLKVMDKSVDEILLACSSENPDGVPISILDHVRTKQQLNNALIHHCGGNTQIAGKIYRSLKPYFKERGIV